VTVPHDAGGMDGDQVPGIEQYVNHRFKKVKTNVSSVQHRALRKACESNASRQIAAAKVMRICHHGQQICLRSKYGRQWTASYKILGDEKPYFNRGVAKALLERTPALFRKSKYSGLIRFNLDREAVGEQDVMKGQRNKGLQWVGYSSAHADAICHRPLSIANEQCIGRHVRLCEHVIPEHIRPTDTKMQTNGKQFVKVRRLQKIYSPNTNINEG
jgi:hypothetical protein